MSDIDYDARQDIARKRLKKAEGYLGEEFTVKQRVQLIASLDCAFVDGINQGTQEKEADFRIMIGLSK